MMTHLLWKNLTRSVSVTAPLWRRNFSENLPVLTLYTKEHCSLCDEAKEALQKFSSKDLLDIGTCRRLPEEDLNVRFVLKEVDITAPGNEEWKRLYQYDIPVFHFNGKYLMRHRVDENLFQKKLAEKSFI